MATTQIADIYNPLTFQRRMQEGQIELNRFLASGIAVADPLLTAQFAQGGNIGDLPQFNGITITEPNISSDNPASNAVPGKITSKRQIARAASRNYHWSTMDLARDLALEDPAGAIINRVSSFWASDDEKRVINSSVGILNDNVANDSGDMVVEKYSDIASPTDANKVSANAIIETQQTMGDHQTKLSTIAVHSVVFTNLRKQQLLVDNVDPVSGVIFQTYLGLRVVVDDSLPVFAGSNSPRYISILFGAGAFSHGMGRVLVPSAVDRNELAGDGGGEEILSSRVNSIFHPNGFQCIGDAFGKPAAATYTELQAAATWTRVVERKNVPMAFLSTNG